MGRGNTAALSAMVSLGVICLAWGLLLMAGFCSGANFRSLFKPVQARTYATIGLHQKEDALESLIGRVGAFGDFDSDRFTDIFWIDRGETEVSVQRWNHKTGNFDVDPSATAQLPDDLTTMSRRYLSVVPSDFNFDGKMDLLVVSTDGISMNSTLLLYFGGLGAAAQGEVAGNMHKETAKLSPILSAHPLVVGRAIGQVLLMEANGDLQPDLFGEALLGSESAQTAEGILAPRRHYWVNQLQRVAASCFNGVKDEGEEDVDCGGTCYQCHCFLSSSPGCGFLVQSAIPRHMSGGQMLFEPLSTTRAHAFADVNGDCISDLIVATENDLYEVWLNARPDGNMPNFLPPTDNLVLSLPPGAGSVSVVDFDRDGSLDLMYAVSAGCTGAPNVDEQSPCQVSEVHVALNVRLGAHAGPLELCAHNAAETTFGIASPGADDGEIGHTGRRRVAQVVADVHAFEGASLFGGRQPLPHQEKSASHIPQIWSDLGMDPRMLHIADLDLDGYPDVAVAGRDADGEARLVVLKSAPFVNDKSQKRTESESREAGRLGGGQDVGGRTLARMKCASLDRGVGFGVEKGECDLDELSGLTGVFAAGFVDLYGEGRNDLIVLYADDVGVLKAKVLANNLNHKGNLFIKAQGLNGVCPEWCGDGVAFPDPKPFGVNYPGVSITYSMRDLSNQRRSAQGAQLPQSTRRITVTIDNRR